MTKTVLMLAALSLGTAAIAQDAAMPMQPPAGAAGAGDQAPPPAGGSMPNPGMNAPRAGLAHDG